MYTRFIYKLTKEICIVVDKDNDVICTFKKHKFKETQNYEVPDKQFNDLSFTQMAKIIEDITIYLNQNHKKMIF